MADTARVTQATLEQLSAGLTAYDTQVVVEPLAAAKNARDTQVVLEVICDPGAEPVVRTMPLFYAWSPRFTFHSAPLSAFSWEIAPTTLGMAGYKHAGFVRMTYVSSAAATLTFTVDGTAQAGITVASSSGVQYQAVFRVPVMKGRLWAIALESAGEFRLDTRDSYVEFREWGTDDAYQKLRVFSEFSIIEG